MKKTAIALTLTSLLTLPLVVSSDAWAAPVRSLQKEQNYEQFISKRQVVDQLLADAARIFHSTARVSDAGFTAKMPSNMEQVTTLLLEAHQLEPYRTDLLISAANAQIYNGNVDRAIALFEQALTAAPDDLDINTYLATWQRFKGNQAKSDGYLKRVGELNAGRAADLQRLFATVDRVVATPSRSVRDGARRRGAAPSSPWAMPSIPMAPCTTSCWDASRPPAPWPRPIRQPSSSSPAACPRTARPRAS